MQRQFIFAILLGASLLIVSAAAWTPAALAADPQPYQYALIKCTGLPLATIQSDQQAWDTAYGWAHQLTTDADWVSSYPARVNEYAREFGCPTVLNDDGQLTLFYKIYAPRYTRALGKSVPQ